MIIYLAIPYSFSPMLSFNIANKISAKLIEDGHVVFSPISHSHPIADFMSEEKRLDHELWMKQDLPFVKLADELHVVCIGEFGHQLIEDSRGVQKEINYAKELNKQIKIIEHYE
jgi:hypothetical protein